MTEPKSKAELLAERTAKAVAWSVQKWAATDLATIIDDLPMPESASDKADKIADVTETYFLAIGHVAARTYALCLLQSATDDGAGKAYRSEGVQTELRIMTNRIAKGVFSK